MSKALVVSLALSALACAPLLIAQDESSYQPFSPDQLDNLLAPIALYPDPLLAQVLPAATFPDQIDEAARLCRAGTTPDDIDMQPWDVSVKAVAHYPTVLYSMADSLDWTTAVGQAYVNQNDDVMASIQRLRQEARAAGNLVTTPQEDVEADDGYIEIWPGDPQFCYLPVYDPGLVFFGSGGVFGGPVITFGTGYPIGVWLSKDFDWRNHRIYYHGWSGQKGWISRSRPYIHINPMYVNYNLKNVAVNRGVTARQVNYANLTRYDSVHQNVAYGKVPVNARAGNTGPASSVNNKIIQRNGNVNDSRIDQYRGRDTAQPTTARSEPNRAAPSPPAAEPPRAAEAPRAPERTENPAFGGDRGNIGARASSERGQSSRASRPAPAPRSSGGGGGGGSHGGGGGGGGSHGGGGGRH